MKSDESTKSIVERWREDTAHLSPAQKKRLFDALKKTEAARKARLEAEPPTGKTTERDQ
jgi:hypothetical protein